MKQLFLLVLIVMCGSIAKAQISTTTTIRNSDGTTSRASSYSDNLGNTTTTIRNSDGTTSRASSYTDNLGNTTTTIYNW